MNINKLYNRKPGKKFKQNFFSEMFLLTNSGMDLKTALGLIKNDRKNGYEKEFLEKIHLDLIHGKSFSTALVDTGNINLYEFYCIKMGEESGRLKEVLGFLNEYFEKRNKIRRQLISLFSYPVILFFFSMSILVFMLKVIVPVFSDIFLRSGNELPWITGLIIKLSSFISLGNIFLFLLLFSGIGYYIFRYKKERFYQFTTTLIIKIPYWGKFIKKIYLSRFTQGMALLSEAKVSIPKAMELMEKMIRFYPIEKTLKPIKEDIINGNSFHKSMEKHAIFDSRMLYMVKAGEEVNLLNLIFSKLAKTYQEEVEHESQIMNTLLEPLMILFIGFLVAFILIALYLPLFQMGGLMEQ